MVLEIRKERLLSRGIDHQSLRYSFSDEKVQVASIIKCACEITFKIAFMGHLFYFFLCLAKLIISDTFKSWLEIIFIFFIHFMATQGHRFPEVSEFNPVRVCPIQSYPRWDSNLQPSYLQPDAMTNGRRTFYIH